MSLKNKSKKNGIVSTIVFCFVMVLVSGLFIFYRQNIIDQITVWQYKPSSEINALAERTGLNDNGKFMFMASQPKLEQSDEFNKVCSKIENTNSILGCYRDNKIYIYDVPSSEIDGVKEVTAAHETLHAIYARLTADEKSYFNKFAEIEYQKLKTDKDFTELMAFYERTEPGERYNELHSIIGTEVSSISPELEEYYSKYFSDRKKVVSLNSNYIGIFKTLKKRDEELTIKIDEISALITKDKAEYKSEAIQLDNDINNFNNRADNNGFSTQSQFNYEKSLLLTRSANLEAMRININNNVTLYESYIIEHNENAAESQKKYNIIDSTLPPAPSV